MKLPRGMSGDQERGWFLSVHRTPRTWGPRVSVASATSVCSRLLLILFFSVSPWLLRNKICDCWKQRTWRTPRRRRKNRPQLPSFFPHQTGPPVQMLRGEYLFLIAAPSRCGTCFQLNATLVLSFPLSGIYLDRGADPVVRSRPPARHFSISEPPACTAIAGREVPAQVALSSSLSST